MSIDPQPTNPIGWLIMILIGFLLYAGASPSSQTVATPEPDLGGRTGVPRDEAGRRVPITPLLLVPDSAEFLTVEHLEITTLDSLPPFVYLDVRGYWPNGCSAEPQVVKQRDGDVITVQIYRVLPMDVMCTMVITPAEMTIEISDMFIEDGRFRSGDYTIQVNGASLLLPNF